ncbi:hypothetical protein [Streptomyces sp. NPDC056061]|uniref:hypothetical protein n=1 Tax=Streptomyces sp. NPDC056061 TaxID=3345700 RepID=UPI0035DE83A8
MPGLGAGPVADLPGLPLGTDKDFTAGESDGTDREIWQVRLDLAEVGSRNGPGPAPGTGPESSHVALLMPQFSCRSSQAALLKP